ncbi:MAG: N-acetylmuramoyl-L-alanine amidase [Desulfosudaceae bacterium]
MTKESRISLLIFGFCVAVAMVSCASYSGNIKNRFFEAENCYQELKDHPGQQQYRASWKKCIDGYLGVYSQDPSGRWASAGLYKAGLMYHELSQRSGLSRDKRRAVDLLKQVVWNFPDSAYSTKAADLIKEITGQEPDRVRTIRRKTDGKAKMKFFAAEASQKSLRESSRRKKYRSYWKDCIAKYKDVHEYDPEGKWAAAALFEAARLNCDLYRYSYKKADQETGISLFEKIINNYPESDYRDKAVAELNAIRSDGRTETETAPETNPETEPETEPETDSEPTPNQPDDPVGQAIARSAPAAAAPDRDEATDGPAIVEDLRFWSNPSYTRVVIDASHQTKYTHNILKEDKANNKPRRLYVDLEESRLHQTLTRKIVIDDNLLKDVRAGQYQPDAVRVVVDIKSFNDYKIFSLRDPFRIVIDVSGQDRKFEVAEEVGPEEIPTEEEQTSLAAQLGLNVRRIVIDPGHGGRDGGAPGYLKGIHEKKLVLEMATKLASRIRREIGCEVILTRENDTFLTLEERTAIANTKNADLFISLHTNACMTRDAHGIETYILNLATDEDAMRVAARENNTSRKNISDLQAILSSLMQNTKISESSRLAGSVQESVCGHLEQHYSRIKNKGVKQAPFYVLLGAQMPSILIEAGFISNSRECRRLTDEKYQDRICEGIVKGVKEYIKKTRSSAFIPSPQEG